MVATTSVPAPSTDMMSQYLQIGEQRQALSSFRGRRNLVLVLPGVEDSPAALSLLRGLASHRAGLELERATVLVIVTSAEQAARLSRDGDSDFRVYWDANGGIYQAAGAVSDSGEPRSAVLVLDRWGTEYARYLPAPGEPWPSVADILAWLEYIQIQCPE